MGKQPVYLGSRIREGSRMNYYHRISGAPIRAIQFTDKESARKIAREFACEVEIIDGGDTILVGCNSVKRGNYAVLAVCSIISMDPETFGKRFKKDERQMELF